MKKSFRYLSISYYLFLAGNNVFCTPCSSSSLFMQTNTDSSWQSQSYNAYQLLKDGKYELAEKEYENALRTFMIKNKKNDPIITGTLLNLGICKKNLLKWNDAISCYQQAVAICLGNKDTSNYLANAYNNLGNIFNQQGDYSKALIHFENALIIYQHLIEKSSTHPESYLGSEASVYNNLGLVNTKLKNYHDAEIQLLSSLSLKEEISKQDMYSPCLNLANLYAWRGELHSADHFYSEAIKNIEAYSPSNISQRITIFLSYGWFLIEKMNKLEEGLAFYKNALKLALSFRGLKHPETAWCYSNIGGYYVHVRDYTKALQYYQEALFALSPGSYSEDFMDNPPVEGNLSGQLMVLALKNKANVMLLLANSLGSDTMLEVGFECSMKALSLVELIRSYYQDEESKLILAENEAATYHLALLLAYRLYEKTHARKYLGLTFEIAERSKSAIQQSAVRNNEALQFGDVPDDLRKKDLFINQEITHLTELRLEAQNEKQVDTLLMNQYNAQIFNVMVQKDSLVQYLEKKYPAYYGLKYNTKVISLEELQNKLRNNQIFIEYAVADTFIIGLSVLKNDARIALFPNNEELRNNLDLFISAVEINNPGESLIIRYNNFVSSAHILYKQLMLPFSEQTARKEIIISPDAQLNLVPFELLLTSKADPDKEDFRNLPYLLFSNEVSYANTATLLFNPVRNSTRIKNRLLAFAPDYQAKSSATHASEIRRQYRDELHPIPGAREEVKKIRKMIGGKAFLGNEASEVNFKKYASNYDILHLAMHTYIDNEYPMLSKLIFSDIPEGLEDNLLNVSEIYNLQLKANMTVLSSCKSGYGKLSEGEGVISLARGFFYAGCPSIVMSLWEVEDHVSNNIMTSFYKYLKKGYRKQKAMALAKRKFLENAEPVKTLPYYWACYVVIGSTRSVFISIYLKYTIISILLIAVAFMTIKWGKESAIRRNIL